MSEGIDIKKNILEYNDKIAEENKKLFEEKGIFVINLISAPGSGKTTLLEKTVEKLGKDYKLSFLIGDVDTERDAERLKKHNADAYQIITGGTCHLEADMIRKALSHINEKPDFLFIENVGNLVCPASFYLGEHLRVVLVSIPEGEDKPSKYPKAFKTSQVFLITKTDLKEYFGFNIEAIKSDALSLNPRLKIIEISSKNNEGISEWIDFLIQKRKEFLGI